VAEVGQKPSGFTVWLTGVPGAGKSALARALAERLNGAGRPVEILDGDEVRTTISRGLGFTKEDRDTNVERIGYVARLLARNGVAVLVAAVSPYRDARDRVKAQHEAPFFEVFVDCSIEELRRRDKGQLYSRAERGEVLHLTGVSDPYEPPLAPAVHIRTHLESVSESCVQVLGALPRNMLSL
jgi:adenylyl-sulfate kinase